ncbi:MAG: Minf_1886 family protein [Planctomycetota bacterium]
MTKDEGREPGDEAKAAGRYRPEAYMFVSRGLEHTMKMVGERRHVTGAELCEGLRRYALAQYGMLARLVLARWGITATGDFGNIVYELIARKQMSKTESDLIEDFQDLYDFREVFDEAEDLRFRVQKAHPEGS